MGSLWSIALKRCRLTVRSGWFLGAWAVGGVMTVATVSVSWLNYQERVSLFEARELARELAVDGAQTWRGVELGVERPPDPLSLLSRGVGEELGSSATVRGAFGPVAYSRRDAPAADEARRGNPDFAWALALVVGFTCVFSGHAVINGEKQKGTLKQQLARGLPRSSLLLGEFLGGLLTVAVPCAVLFLGFSTWAVLAGPGLTGEDWPRVGLWFVLVVLYGCFWLAASLALSVVCREPATSLVAGVLAWAVSAALYPQLAGWAAARAAPPVPGQYEHLADTRPGLSPGRAGAERTSDGDRDRSLARRNARSAEYRLYRRFAALLPVTAMLDAGQVLAGTSPADHERFLRHVDDAERSFGAWQAEKLERYPEREFRMDSRVPLDIEGLPEPVWQDASLTWSLRQAGLPLAALVFGATGLVLVAGVGFERLDVR